MELNVMYDALQGYHLSYEWVKVNKWKEGMLVGYCELLSETKASISPDFW